MSDDESIKLVSGSDDSENTLLKTAGIVLIGAGLMIYAANIAAGGLLAGMPASFVLLGCAFLLAHKLRK